MITINVTQNDIALGEVPIRARHPLSFAIKRHTRDCSVRIGRDSAEFVSLAEGSDLRESRILPSEAVEFVRKFDARYSQANPEKIESFSLELDLPDWATKGEAP